MYIYIYISGIYIPPARAGRMSDQTTDQLYQSASIPKLSKEPALTTVRANLRTSTKLLDFRGLYSIISLISVIILLCQSTSIPKLAKEPGKKIKDK